MTRRAALFSWLPFLALMAMPLGAGEFPQLDAWLGSQEKIQTWSADFVQTRTFKALAQPLMATGQVWFTDHVWIFSCEPSQASSCGNSPAPSGIAMSARKGSHENNAARRVMTWARLERSETIARDAGGWPARRHAGSSA